MAHHELALPDRTGAEQVPAAWQQPHHARFLAQCPERGRPPPRQDPHRSPAPPLRGRPLTRPPGPATGLGSPPVGVGPRGKQRPEKGVSAPGTRAGQVATVGSRARSGRLPSFLALHRSAWLAPSAGGASGRRPKRGSDLPDKALEPTVATGPAPVPAAHTPIYGLSSADGPTPIGETPPSQALHRSE